MKIVLLNTSTLKDKDPAGERLLAAGFALLKTPHTYAEIVSLVLDTSSCMRVAIAVTNAAIAAVFYEDADLPGCYLTHLGFSPMFYRLATQKEIYAVFRPPEGYRTCVGWVSPERVGLLRLYRSLGLFPTGRTVRANPSLVEFEVTCHSIEKASWKWVKRRATKYPSHAYVP